MQTLVENNVINNHLNVGFANDERYLRFLFDMITEDFIKNKGKYYVGVADNFTRDDIVTDDDFRNLLVQDIYTDKNQVFNIWSKKLIEEYDISIDKDWELYICNVLNYLFDITFDCVQAKYILIEFMSNFHYNNVPIDIFKQFPELYQKIENIVNQFTGTEIEVGNLRANIKNFLDKKSIKEIMMLDDENLDEDEINDVVNNVNNDDDLSTLFNIELQKLTNNAITDFRKALIELILYDNTEYNFADTVNLDDFSEPIQQKLRALHSLILKHEFLDSYNVSPHYTTKIDKLLRSGYDLETAMEKYDDEYGMEYIEQDLKEYFSKLSISEIFNLPEKYKN